MTTIIVWIVSYEHSPGTCSSTGFNWFYEKEDAEEAYCNAQRSDNHASFFFSHEIEKRMTHDEITNEIDSQIDDLNALATIRTVGKNVLSYWRKSKFQMGSATQPAPAHP